MSNILYKDSQYKDLFDSFKADCERFIQKVLFDKRVYEAKPEVPCKKTKKRNPIDDECNKLISRAKKYCPYFNDMCNLMLDIKRKPTTQVRKRVKSLIKENHFLQQIFKIYTDSPIEKGKEQKEFDHLYKYAITYRRGNLKKLKSYLLEKNYENTSSIFSKEFLKSIKYLKAKAKSHSLKKKKFLDSFRNQKMKAKVNEFIKTFKKDVTNLGYGEEIPDNIYKRFISCYREMYPLANQESSTIRPKRVNKKRDKSIGEVKLIEIDVNYFAMNICFLVDESIDYELFISYFNQSNESETIISKLSNPRANELETSEIKNEDCYYSQTEKGGFNLFNQGEINEYESICSPLTS